MGDGAGEDKVGLLRLEVDEVGGGAGMSVSCGLAQPYIPCKQGDRPGRPVESTSNSIGSPISTTIDNRAIETPPTFTAQR
jgi:hypothetical protein